MTAEQEARDMLVRLGVSGADHWSAGEVVELANLLEERDALRKDAERYRWLRDTGNNTWVPFTAHWKMSAAHCDHTIDAAMATEPTK